MLKTPSFEWKNEILLLIMKNEEQRCSMVEWLLENPEDVLHFDDKTLISKTVTQHITVSTGTATSFTETNKIITEHYWF